MKNIIFAIATAITFVTTQLPAQALTVSPTNDANLLASQILGSGINLISSTYTGSPGASGTFTNGISSVGIASGIILTTGSAVGAEGPNNSPSYSVANNLPGTPQLNALSGNSTHDASVLDLTFNSDSNNISFKFVFASEEYNEYVNSSYNDVFGFFLDGQNIALLPDGTPVAINNVNLGKNSSYYINNDTEAPLDIQYDGLTTVLTAQALNIGAGNHTISLQIADTSDSSWDSAVFIEAGSFSDTTPSTVPEPTTMLLMGIGIAGATLIKSRKKNFGI